MAQTKNLAEKQQMVDAVGKAYNTGAVQTFDERYEGVKGSPFLTEEWIPGKVRMNNGHVFDGVRLKYDLYRDELIVKRQDGAEVIPDKQTIRSFVLLAPKRQFVRIGYLINYRKFPYNHFAEVLYQGKSTLLAVHRKKLIKADYRGAYHADRPYDAFDVATTQHYWVSAEGQVHELKPRRKSLRRTFGDHQAAVTTFIQENGIDLNRAEDLVQLIQYYDQL